MRMIRLDKYLADMQIGTRSQVKQLLKKGLVTVNGEPVSKPEFKIDPSSDRVYFDNKPLNYNREVYYMLYKPAGVVSATRDNHDKTVLDLITSEDRRDDLSPVGRLDKDTTGLLLLTNDGALSHALLSPRHHVDKTYLVKTADPITPAMARQFEEGLDIGDEKRTLPAKLNQGNVQADASSMRQEDMSPDSVTLLQEKPQDTLETAASAGDSAAQNALLSCDPCLCTVTIQEGRFHQIKRMFHAVGTEVVALKRLSMGPLKLDESLKPGAYRPLTEEEIRLLKERN